MMDWLKRLISNPDVPIVAKTREAAIRVSQKEKDEELLAVGTCPDCRSESSMHLGPEGGSANNCMCIACRHEWNLLLFNGVTILDDMGRASEQRARTIYGWEKDTATPTRELTSAATA